MIGQFDETFYKNKRSALLSSLILIGASAFYFRVEGGVVFYAFKVNAVSHGLLIAILITVCVYFNLAHILHYITEVPRWMRDPDEGLQKVETAIARLDDLNEKLSREQETLFRFRSDAVDALKRLTVESERQPSGDLVHNIQAGLSSGIGRKHDGLHMEIFNGLSAAIRKSVGESGAHKKLNWSEMADAIIKLLAERISAKFPEAFEMAMGDRRSELTRSIRESERALQEAAKADGERAKQLLALNAEFGDLERKLRRWRTAMDIRLKAQYFWLPTSLFVVAVLFALANLYFNFGANVALGSAA